VESGPFFRHFQEVWGERWSSLCAALQASPERTNLSLFDGYSHYQLDQASIWAAQALGAQSGERVLDMCAAPGGKTLVLLQTPGLMVTSNEYSFARRKRLQEVIVQHVPVPERERVHIGSWDGNQFGLRKPEEYDRVLVDAPCSSERHLIEQKKTDEWTLARTRQLAKRQYSLLCSGLLTVKPGGMVLYSTCSISPDENDGVIARALERKSDLCELDLTMNLEAGMERTQFGVQIFPDRSDNAGPMYFSRLRRRD
jgi:16S rRNA C967 or C1407 C5-methylase (RsmB/RsmF family)